MSEHRSAGGARFKNGRLVLPGKGGRRGRDNAQRSLFNDEKPTRKNKRASESESVSLDLDEWKREHPEEWTEMKNKVTDERLERRIK